MKKLILIRHAKARDIEYRTSDHDRALTDRGRSDAELMAGILQREGHLPERVIASSSVRTRQTADILAELTGDPPVSLKSELYLGGQEVLLKTAYELPGNVNSAALVGHNPDIAWAAAEFAPGKFNHAPTCCVFCFGAPDWRTFDPDDPGEAELLFYGYPKLFK